MEKEGEDLMFGSLRGLRGLLPRERNKITEDGRTPSVVLAPVCTADACHCSRCSILTTPPIIMHTKS